MKTNIYFVRHAQSDYSIHDDQLRPLTEKGLSDVLLVTEALKDKNIEVIYSSPFKRAYDTVNGLADTKGLEIIVVDDFKERKIDDEWITDFGAFSRRQWEDFDFRLENGESLKEVQERNIAALYEVLRKNPGRSVAVGSHGTALSTVMNYFNPGFGYEDFQAIKDKMPFIIRFEFDDMKFTGMEEVNL